MVIFTQFVEQNFCVVIEKWNRHVCCYWWWCCCVFISWTTLKERRRFHFTYDFKVSVLFHFTCRERTHNNNTASTHLACQMKTRFIQFLQRKVHTETAKLIEGTKREKLLSYLRNCLRLLWYTLVLRFFFPLRFLLLFLFSTYLSLWFRCSEISYDHWKLIVTFLFELYFLHGSFATRDYDMKILAHSVWGRRKDENLRTINYWSAGKYIK